jgi:hypothetical protein
MVSEDRSTRWFGVWLAVAAAFAMFVACDEALLDGGPPEASGEPRVVAVGGEQLLAQLGSLFDTSLRVRVLDADGRPIRSAVVQYTLLVGSGVFSSDSTLTDDQGFTEVTFRPALAGMTIIEARAERPGGTGRVQFTIQVLSDPTEAAAMTRVSGDNQSGEAGTELPLPLVVRVDSPDGLPVGGHSVTFTLEQSQGASAAVMVAPDGPAAGEVTVNTDGGGVARAYLKLGTAPGAHSVTARTLIGPAVAQTTTSQTFTATATALGPARLIIVAGNNQTAVIDTLHQPGSPDFQGRDPNPFVVQAVDEFGSPVSGIAVTWLISDGGGFLTASPSFTDANGLTQSRLLAVTEGRNAAVAIAAGTNAVEFVVTGQMLAPPTEGGDGDGG